MTPSPSDPDLWTVDPADFDDRDVVDDPPFEVGSPPDWPCCVECDQRLDDDGPEELVCWNCQRLHDATRGDLEETDAEEE